MVFLSKVNISEMFKRAKSFVETKNVIPLEAIQAKGS